MSKGVVGLCQCPAPAYTQGVRSGGGGEATGSGRPTSGHRAIEEYEHGGDTDLDEETNPVDA